MSATGPRSESGLVPLADRLRFMQMFRLAVAVVVIGTVSALPHHRVLSLTDALLISGIYIAATAPTMWLSRLPRRLAIGVFNLTLLADGVYLAAVSYAHGFGSPWQYLILMHLIAVTLAASFRTGLKVALWHSVLVFVCMQLQDAGKLTVADEQVGSSRGAAIALLIVIVWIVTLTTAMFAAVNERELRRRNYDLDALAKFSWRLERSLAPKQVAQTLVDAVADSFAMRRPILAAGNEHFSVLASVGAQAAGDHDLDPAEDDLVQQALGGHEPVRITRPRPAKDPWLCQALPGARNILVFPMYAEGTPIGVLVVEHGERRGPRIERRIVEIVERFVSQAGLALANAWLLDQVRTMAATDGLTGVANRRTFETLLRREIARAARGGATCSLIMVDLDHFKALNDTYGHQAGDKTLQRTAAALQRGCRPGDTVARYGGEEFAVLLPYTEEQDGQEIAERLRVAIAQVDDGPLVTASLGVATFPSAATDGEGLVRAADDALYAAKRGGRNRVIVAPPRMLDRIPPQIAPRGYDPEGGEGTTERPRVDRYEP